MRALFVLRLDPATPPRVEAEHYCCAQGVDDDSRPGVKESGGSPPLSLAREAFPEGFFEAGAIPFPIGLREKS